MKKRITFFVASVSLMILAFATTNLGKLQAQTSAMGEGSIQKIDLPSKAKKDARFKVGSLYYTFLNEAKGQVAVAPCLDFESMYQYDIVIPETIKYAKKGEPEKEYTVVAIGKSAFANCFNLSSVKIPQTIVTIGDVAFWGTSLEEIILPNSVEEIGNRCFKASVRLRTLHIGKGLKKYGADLFDGCWNLQDIEVDPDNTVLKSENGILYDKAQTVVMRCPSFRKSVKKIELPSTVTKVARGAFEYCRYIEELVLNEGLKEIGGNAFYLCSGLKTMKIPASVEKIEDGSAFILLAGCEKFDVDPANPHYSTLMNGRILFNKETKTMVSLLYTTDKATITIPAEVEHIGAAAMMVILEGGMDEYYGGKGTEQVILPENLLSIGNFAFAGTNIGSIKVPDKVEEIPNGMVADCKRLTFVALGKGCKKIGFGVFEDCSRLMNDRTGVIRCYAEVPPQMAQNSKGEYAEFNEEVVKRTVLQVPEASVSNYVRADGWKAFLRIKKLEGQANEDVVAAALSIKPSKGMLTIVTTEEAPLCVYALDGTILYTTTDMQATVELPQGVYIVTYQGKAYKAQVF